MSVLHWYTTTPIYSSKQAYVNRYSRTVSLSALRDYTYLTVQMFPCRDILSLFRIIHWKMCFQLINTRVIQGDFYQLLQMYKLCLCHSTHCDGAYCLPCMLFAKSDQNNWGLLAGPLIYFHNARKSFKRNQDYRYHNDACQCMMAFKMRMEDERLPVYQNSVCKQVSHAFIGCGDARTESTTS